MEMEQRQVKVEMHSNGFFMPEPIPLKKMFWILRRRAHEKWARQQNAMLYYVIPVHGGADDGDGSVYIPITPAAWNGYGGAVSMSGIIHQDRRLN